MRIAIVSDIHSNFDALEAVAADFHGVDQIWCLGDVVGYGPEPGACVEWVRKNAAECIAGNHDWAAIRKVSVRDFNDVAATAALWTGSRLSDADTAYLESLPSTREIDCLPGSEAIRRGVTLAHGSPRDPIWEYLVNARLAGANFPHFPGDLCFVGHSHQPVAFSLDHSRPGGPEPTRPRVEPARFDRPVEIGSARHIVNAGSVGQPRDGDPAARYVILDTDARSWEWRRVEYDIGAVQTKIRAVGLPDILWMRLAYGR